ncbi:MAG: B-4DMT family transporter [Mycolicibacterium sp.]|nr:B-4DMT family transporter [Mycolicibacterium sp.]
MMSWLLRGVVFALLMVVLRLIQGALINTYETKALLISICLILIPAIPVLTWGFVDGVRDARAQPDPDRRRDLAMTWLIAGLVAGVLSGLACWIISKFYQPLYVGGLLNEVTTFAAFTALLVFLGAVIGFGAGRWVTDRRYKKEAAARGEADESADTDVFEAVREAKAQDAEDRPRQSAT